MNKTKKITGVIIPTIVIALSPFIWEDIYIRYTELANKDVLAIVVVGLIIMSGVIGLIVADVKGNDDIL